MSTTQLAPGDDGATTSGALGAGTGPASAPTYAEIQRSAEFADLRRRFRRFVFPLTALFLVWYFLYVLLAAFAPGFMGHELFGNINVGLLFGLGQFVSTFAITMIYARWAGRTFDPAAEALRSRFEAGRPAETGRLAETGQPA
ncbi:MULTISPECIES: DUF485 domain-containing protein [unclassified Frankia]|uniref:DUF485 domain-containing protein n=1 Tax=unclassified Frankia TaxID=2632575 RepID=UPI0009F9D182|nr:MULTISPECIES: DUF485 domain-containing protein [unclassified Frankia]